MDVLQYIDDRLIAELMVSRHDKDAVCPTRRSEVAAYIKCQVLIRLGYFLSITKSVLSMPVNYIKFLGVFSDTNKMAFIVPQDKTEKFGVAGFYFAKKQGFRQNVATFCR